MTFIYQGGTIPLNDLKENNYKVLAFLFILYWHHNCVTDALLMQFH